MNDGTIPRPSDRLHCAFRSRVPLPQVRQVSLEMIAIQTLHWINSAGVQTIRVALCLSSRGGGLATQSAKVINVFPSPMPSALEASRSVLFHRDSRRKIGSPLYRPMALHFQFLDPP